MKTFTLTRAVQAALIAAAIGGTSTAVMADIKDYKFEFVDQTDPDRSRQGHHRSAHEYEDRKVGTRRGDLRDAARYGSGRHAGDGDQDCADAGRRAWRPTNLRPASAWPAAGSFRSAPRSRARPAPSRTSSSSRRRSEPGRLHQRHHRRVDRGGGGRVRRGTCSMARDRHPPAWSLPLRRRALPRRSTIRIPTANLRTR